MTDVLDGEGPNLVVQLVNYAPVADAQAVPRTPGQPLHVQLRPARIGCELRSRISRACGRSIRESDRKALPLKTTRYTPGS